MKTRSRPRGVAIVIKREASTGDISGALPGTNCQNQRSGPEIKQETDDTFAACSLHDSKYNPLECRESGNTATSMETINDDIKQEGGVENGSGGLQEGTVYSLVIMDKNS